MTPGRSWFDQFDRSKKTQETAADATERVLVELTQRLTTEMDTLEARLQSDEEINDTELQEKRISLLALFDMHKQTDVRYNNRSKAIDTKASKGVGAAAVPVLLASSALVNSGENKGLLGVAGALGVATALIALYVRSAKLIRDIDNRTKTNKAVGGLERKLNTL